MPYWSTQRIRSEQARGGGLVAPFDEARLKQGAYELALSREVLITGTAEEPNVADERNLMIPAGQFALLFTEESIAIPSNVIAFISIKATVKLDGLVNISGFHVDPGFSGKLKFSVYNAGNQSIFLEYGRPTFLIWFAEFDEPTEDPYEGSHKNQNRIVPQDRQRMSHESQSPAALAKRLEAVERELERRAANLRSILFGILIPLAIGTIMALFGSWLRLRESSAPAPITVPTALPKPLPLPTPSPSATTRP